jgi:hypothetical protein
MRFAAFEPGFERPSMRFDSLEVPRQTIEPRFESFEPRRQSFVP